MLSFIALISLTFFSIFQFVVYIRRNTEKKQLRKEKIHHGMKELGTKL